MNKEFNAFLREKSVHRELTPARSSASNGFIERENRTLLDHARSMLHGAKAPAMLWAEAVNATAHILNRMSFRRRNNSVTPFEVWFGKKPDVQHLRVWGCVVFVKELGHVDKLKPRSRKGHLVGYSGDTIYRVFHQESRIVVETRDVVFDETVMFHAGDTSSTLFESLFDEDTDGSDIERENDATSRVDSVISVHQHDEDNIDTEAADEAMSLPPAKKRGRPLGSKKKPKSAPEPHLMTLRPRRGFGLVVLSDDAPTSVEEAIAGVNSKEWIAGMGDEMQSLIKNKTWTLVQLPAGRKTVKNKWVFTKKTGIAGETRFKARLVAKGFTQRPGIDFHETYAPVARFDTIRLTLAEVARLDLDMVQIDIKTAFLHGDLDEEIYMDQPAGFTDGTDRVCRLHKSLYGLKQAPRRWNDKFNSFLLKHGLQRSQEDECLYFSRSNGFTVLVIYVDDGLIAGDNTDEIQKILKELNDTFEMRQSDPSTFVGLEISRRREERSLSITQTAYIDKMLSKFNMSDCNPVKVPGTQGSSGIVGDAGVKHETATSLFPYRELVGSLLFAATVTRPDIAFCVADVSRFLVQPTSPSIMAAKKILRYLKATRTEGITYAGDKDLVSFCDAGFVNNVDNPRFFGGRVHMLNGGAFSWSSKLFRTIAHSTCEAEYMVISEAAKDIMWIKRLLIVFRRRYPVPRLLRDNQGAVDLVRTGGYRPRTRHVAPDYHWTRELQKQRQLEVVHVPTEEQAADILTKALPEGKHVYCRRVMGIL